MTNFLAKGKSVKKNLKKSWKVKNYRLGEMIAPKGENNTCEILGKFLLEEKIIAGIKEN